MLLGQKLNLTSNKLTDVKGLTPVVITLIVVLALLGIFSFCCIMMFWKRRKPTVRKTITLSKEQKALLSKESKD